MNADHFIPLSSSDFATLGIQSMAYIKPVTQDGKSAFAIHSADGTTVAVVADRDLAAAIVRQNGLEPVTVH